MKTKIYGHQGDVQFKMINKIPAKAIRVKNQPLAYGEISGHVHILTGNVEMFQQEDKFFCKIGEKGAKLQHTFEVNITQETLEKNQQLVIADHKTIDLPAGIYEFGIQKRYDPFERVFKKVID